MIGESSTSKSLVLDANILLRAVLGTRVRRLFEEYEETLLLYAPDVCFDDARSRVEELAAKRGFDPTEGFLMMDRLDRLIERVEEARYSKHEIAARLRIALLLDCPIWTEDQDFLGAASRPGLQGRLKFI
jgi:predicted nucleic acid-binding protein